MVSDIPHTIVICGPVPLLSAVLVALLPSTFRWSAPKLISVIACNQCTNERVRRTGIIKLNKALLVVSAIFRLFVANHQLESCACLPSMLDSLLLFVSKRTKQNEGPRFRVDCVPLLRSCHLWERGG